MKKTLLICGALLALTASVASAAAGLNFYWNGCSAAAGVSNKTFACTSNTATGHTAIGSYIPPAGVTALTGIEIVIDLASTTSPLPAWWQFKNTGTCRQGSLGMNFVFPGLPGDCQDYYGLAGGASGNLASYNIGNRGPNTARILGVAAVDQLQALPLDETLQYYAFTMTINNLKTVGTGACAGCSDPVCIVLNRIKLTQPAGVGDFAVDDVATSQNLTWQGIGGINAQCPGATPTHSTTWGSVKALYR